MSGLLNLLDSLLHIESMIVDSFHIFDWDHPRAASNETVLLHVIDSLGLLTACFNLRWSGNLVHYRGRIWWSVACEFVPADTLCDGQAWEVFKGLRGSEEGRVHPEWLGWIHLWSGRVLDKRGFGEGRPLKELFLDGKLGWSLGFPRLW